MTLQERMVAVYLRQAKLPPEEKDKLKLFLTLLLETFEEEEPWEKEIRQQVREDRQKENAGEANTPPPKSAPETPATTFSGKPTDPFAEALLAALDKLGMTPESREAEKYFGIRASVLEKAVAGEVIRRDSRERILQRVQDAGIAITAPDVQE